LLVRKLKAPEELKKSSTFVVPESTADQGTKVWVELLVSMMSGNKLVDEGALVLVDASMLEEVPNLIETGDDNVYVVLENYVCAYAKKK